MLLVVRRSGLPPAGVETLPQLLVAGSPPVVVDEQAVLSIDGGLASCRANVRLTDVPGASGPTASVQTEPALLLGVQAQPGEELPGRKVARAGTVSVTATPAAG